MLAHCHSEARFLREESAVSWIAPQKLLANNRFLLVATLLVGMTKGRAIIFKWITINVFQALFGSNQVVPGICAFRATSSFIDRKSTRLNSSHVSESRMPSSA